MAPWQTGLEQFSTQLLAPAGGGTVSLLLIVPSGEWWRIVYLSATAVTVAAAGTRTLQLGISTIAGEIGVVTSVLTVQPPATIGPSTTCNLMIAPQVTAYSNQVDPANAQQVVAIPDLIWPQGTRMLLQYTALQAGDVFDSSGIYAVEIYTEEPRGAAAVVAATPVLV